MKNRYAFEYLPFAAWALTTAVLALLFCSTRSPAFAVGSVGNGTPASCTESALNSALATGGLVTFNCGAEPVTITLTSEKGITLPTTIDGSGKVALSGANVTRVLSVSASSTLTLQNITVTRGFANEGGAIRSEGPLILDGVTVLSNTAIASGGGIYAIGLLTIANSTFASNNSASLTGGGLFSQLTTTIRTTAFVDNRAQTYGGGFIALGPAAISSSSFVSNTTQAASGGGLAGFDATIVSGTSFTGNRATTGNGGGFYAEGPTSVTRSAFTNNQANAGGSGGGFNVNSASNTVFVTATIFVSNAAFTGAGFSTNGPAIVSASTFLTNGGYSGGGISAGGALTVSASSFSGNSGFIGGGFVSTGPASVSNSTFNWNSASSSGGGFFTASAASVSASTFLSNTATTNSGGGLHAYSAASISASRFSGSSAASGGAVSGQSVSVVNSTLNGNQTTSIAGGAAIIANGGVGVVNSTIVDNNGTGGAASLRSVAGALSIQDSIVAGTGSPYCAAGAGVTLLGANVIPGPDVSCGFAPALYQLDPTLGTLNDNGGPTLTFALLPASPAIGRSSGCLATDQRGAPRTLPCDVGAYESGAVPVLSSLDPPAASVFDPGFTLSVRGGGFVEGTVVLWNGAARSTKVISATLLTATIPANDLFAVATASVQARYGSAADGLSNGLTFAVGRRAQTIAFGPLPDRSVSDAPFELSATATSGLPVSYSSDTSTVCTVTSTTVTVGTTGTCTLRASQPGDATYAAAPDVVVSIVFRPTFIFIGSIQSNYALP